MEPADAVPVGDRLWVVLVAYFLVFLPWSAMQAIDFISSEWKSVNHTRRDGWLQFLITLIPISAISVYIHFQKTAGDFKEMSAAIVALFFAIQHLFRTWWGLWQLDEFRRWATNAIRILESQGTQYKILRDYEHPKDPKKVDLCAWKAGQIKVNESVVDNRIFGGRTKCYAVRLAGKRGTRDWMNFGLPNRHRGLVRIYVALQTLCVILGSWCANLVYFLVRGLRIKKQSAEHSFWKLRPHEPVDVWINWSVAFAAQGLDDWIEEFDVIATPPPANGRTSDGYEDRQNYFAREVLASAILLLPDRHFMLDGKKVHFGKGHPLQWGCSEDLESGTAGHEQASCFTRCGKVSKRDMLQHAILAGANLPFGVPHASSQKTGDSTTDTVTGDLMKSGYKSYDYDLKEAVGDMPSKFGNAIDKFNVEMLEWLTIMLSIGIWESMPSGKVDTATEDADQTENGADVENSNNGSELTLLEIEMDNGDETELSETCSALRTLRTQLGLADDDRPLMFEDGSGFSSLPFPLRQVGLGGVLWENRAVLAVSGTIDNWVAINAGECIRAVLKHDEDWKEACLAIPTSLEQNTGMQNGESSPSSGLVSKRSQLTQQLSGKRYLIYANDLLERVRLVAQYGMGEITDLHLDQTVSFIGVVMESVRSALATGLSTGTRVPVARWKPNIDFSEAAGLMTAPVVKFEASQSLACALHSSENEWRGEKLPFSTRPMQMRLLWEVQNHIHLHLQQQSAPENVTAMVACLLGFPSLCFDCKAASLWPAVAVKLDDNDTGVEVNGLPLTILITPLCGPQELHVEVRIASVQKDAAQIFVTLARASRNRDSFFDWEAWRDAFNGRLLGLRKWQMKQGLVVSKECLTRSGIGQGIGRWKLPDPRTGSQIHVWAGWLPSRPYICKYEVCTEGIIRRYAISDMGSYPEGRPVSYFEANQADLTYTLGVVAERLIELGPKEAPTNVIGPVSVQNVLSVVKPVEELVREGKELLQGKKPDFRAALQYFELAARKDSVEGLKHAVTMLTDKKSGQASLAKALFLTKKFGWMYGSRMSPVKDKASAVEEIYRTLLEHSHYHSDVVLGLARFELQRIQRMEFNGSIATFDVMNVLARSFRQTGRIDVVRHMALLCAHCAWVKMEITPLGTEEPLPVTSWGSWLISTSAKRSKLQAEHFGQQPANLTLSELLLYVAGKSMKDWDWMEDILNHHDMLVRVRAAVLGEMSQRNEPHTPARNKRIIQLLRSITSLEAVPHGQDPQEARVLLGDMYELGMRGVEADLDQAVEVFGEGAMQQDWSSTERLRTIAERSDQQAREIAPRILELLHNAAKIGNAKAALVLGAMYENGTGGVAVNLDHAVEFFGDAAMQSGDFSEPAKRLGEIAKLSAKPRTLQVLYRAVEHGNGEAASVLGGIYERGLKQMRANLSQAVEQYAKGLLLFDAVSADRLGAILSRDDEESRAVQPRILEVLRHALEENGNRLAAGVLSGIYEGNQVVSRRAVVEVVVESVVRAVDLFVSGKRMDLSFVALLGKIANRDDHVARGFGPQILEALHKAEEAGLLDAEFALADIYEKGLLGTGVSVSRSVEKFGAIAVLGDWSSISRLGKLALQSGGNMKTRAMQLLHESADLGYTHAVAVQGAVLEAEGNHEDMSRAVEWFGQAALNDHFGAIIRLRNIVQREQTQARARTRAVQILLDVAWRESCSETTPIVDHAGETGALVALGDILLNTTFVNDTDAEEALRLFENASSRIYSRQYSTFQEVGVVFRLARGLAAMTRNPRLSESMRHKARSLLEENAAHGREGPMEFIAAILVNGLPVSQRSVPQAAQLYQELITKENTRASYSTAYFLSPDSKAELLGVAEINAMKSMTSIFEDGTPHVSQSKGLARMLQKRCERIEKRAEEQLSYQSRIADVLNFEESYLA